MNAAARIVEHFALFNKNTRIQNVQTLAQFRQWRAAGDNKRNKEIWFSSFHELIRASDTKKITVITFYEDQQLELLLVDFSHARGQLIRGFTTNVGSISEGIIRDLQLLTGRCLQTEMTCSFVHIEQFSHESPRVNEEFYWTVYCLVRITRQDLDYDGIQSELQRKIIKEEERHELKNILRSIISLPSTSVLSKTHSVSSHTDTSSQHPGVRAPCSSRSQYSARFCPPSDYKKYKNKFLREEKRLPNPIRAQTLINWGIAVPQIRIIRSFEHKNPELIIRDLQYYIGYLSDKIDKTVEVTYDALTKEKRTMKALVSTIEEDQELKRKVARRDNTILRLTNKLKKLESQHLRDKVEIEVLQSQLQPQLQQQHQLQLQHQDDQAEASSLSLQSSCGGKHYLRSRRYRRNSIFFTSKSNQ